MRTLVPQNLFPELAFRHGDIDDLFNRFFGFFPNTSVEGTSPVSWLPAVEAFRKDGGYVVRMDMPGVDPKDVEVSVVEDSLIVKGERKKAKEITEKDYHYQETSYGKFERRLALPKGINRDQVEAHFDNGVLEISVPVSAHLAERKVPILN